MNPVRSIKNQYLGVNAHLHSFWQSSGRWNRFHNVHVTHLMESLKARLIPLGYTAEIEESLQIRRIGDEPRRPRADILIKDTDPRRSHSPAKPTNGGAQALTLLDLIGEEADEEHPYSAIALYEQRTPQQPSEAVAWIELLSPSNKGSSRDAYEYSRKRSELLHGGMVFVEMDYLHETPSTFERLGDYTLHEIDAHPYRIVVLDPRPDVKAGHPGVHEFDVDVPIPTVEIPLNGDDKLVFDFNAAYRQTFEGALYGYDMDYAEMPVNFERYSPADQTRIAVRMLAVLEAAANGVDLESAPFPVKPLALEDALAQIAMLTT